MNQADRVAAVASKEGPEAEARRMAQYGDYLKGMPYSITGNDLKNRYETANEYSKFYLNGEPLTSSKLAQICKKYADYKLPVRIRHEPNSAVKHYDIQQNIDLTSTNTASTGTKDKPLAITKLENSMKKPIHLMQILKEAIGDDNSLDSQYVDDMKSARDSSKNKGFNGVEFKQLVGEAATELWAALNKIEVAQNYLETHGQGGLLSAFDQKFNISELKNIIEALDEYADS